MTPHLHPRSRLTTSLFGTTLLVSFLVVGMPHILPCPAPRVRLTEADYEIMEDGRRRRRRRPENTTTTGNEKQIVVLPSQTTGGEEIVAKTKAHECPVPKPRGLVGEVLGFKSEGKGEKLPRPIIETSKSRKENA